MTNKLNKVFSTALYVIAGVMLIFAAWALTNNIGYIDELVYSGQLAFAGSEFDIINFYMSGSGQYFVFSLLLGTMGYLIMRLPKTARRPLANEPLKTIAEDEDLDGRSAEAEPSDDDK